MGAGQKRGRPASLSDTTTTPDTSTKGSASSSSRMSVFRPPVLRSAALTASQTINKALFSQTFEIAAARVHDNRLISKYQKALTQTHELLRADRIAPVADDPETPAAAAGVPRNPQRRKCLLLHPDVSLTKPETWSDVLRAAVAAEELGVVAYRLTLDYDYWTSRDVLESILPDDFHNDIPTSFNTAGHVAHLNLRSRFQPHKHVVAQVLLDKNAHLRTVINKVDTVGTASVFRTFSYEVLAGPDDMAVEVRENTCTFAFDYSKVYWNSKLEPEHSRLLYLFRPGQVVADVMAGIGPFSVPAGKRGVFVWANDMNPESHSALTAAIARNKVGAYVRAHNTDGLEFIGRVAGLVEAASKAGDGAYAVADTVAPSKPPPARQLKQQKKMDGVFTRQAEPAAEAEPERHDARPTPKKSRRQAAQERTFVSVPPTIDHFVMNLPASATTFLPRFTGLYEGKEALFRGTGRTLPIVHVHCFAPKLEDESIPKSEVCARIARELGVPMTLCAAYADVEADDALADHPTPLVYVHNVRAVAPHKSMYCASFRVPAAVAFAPRPDFSQMAPPVADDSDADE